MFSENLGRFLFQVHSLWVSLAFQKKCKGKKAAASDVGEGSSKSDSLSRNMLEYIPVEFVPKTGAGGRARVVCMGSYHTDDIPVGYMLGTRYFIPL